MGGLRTNMDRLRATRYDPPPPGGESDGERETTTQAESGHRLRPLQKGQAGTGGSGRSLGEEQGYFAFLR